MGTKPLYVIKFVGNNAPEYDGKYYSGDKPWCSVPKEEAEKMTHKEIRAVQSRLHRTIRLYSVLEPA